MASAPASVRKLDRIDRRILRALQEDGRISYVDLAEKVGLSTSPCLERVRRLERDGVIRGYAALLDPSQLDAGLLVFVEISLSYTSGTVFEDFRRAVGRWREILECHLVSGDFDYLLKIRIADITSYRQLLGEILHTLPGVRDSRTLVTMETVQESTRLVVKD
ncbi:MAG: winged helix-turn-helix transcriptional regulator [Gammaproteobacteria bacterium]|nr:winged helix-turn-helix transcriptional regulator [Gammaproteobacteria bacterium]